ncbi:YkgJ family cysteine cluster protein [Saccharibacillus sacchari]|uniref:YkgJ family cysteine cluster protein n=1 Tax=Saccharibacillus sacchari TaxID=456493 RepID=UPI0009FEB0C2
MFACDGCGACCKNLDKSPIYEDLNRGDGVCKYLIDNQCSVYENRPLLCRVDESYEAFFKQIYSLEEYYELNYTMCAKLKI